MWWRVRRRSRSRNRNWFSSQNQFAGNNEVIKEAVLCMVIVLGIISTSGVHASFFRWFSALPYYEESASRNANGEPFKIMSFLSRRSTGLEATSASDSLPLPRSQSNSNLTPRDSEILGNRSPGGQNMPFLSYLIRQLTRNSNFQNDQRRSPSSSLFNPVPVSVPLEARATTAAPAKIIDQTKMMEKTMLQEFQVNPPSRNLSKLYQSPGVNQGQTNVSRVNEAELTDEAESEEIDVIDLPPLLLDNYNENKYSNHKKMSASAPPTPTTTSTVIPTAAKIFLTTTPSPVWTNASTDIHEDHLNENKKLAQKVKVQVQTSYNLTQNAEHTTPTVFGEYDDFESEMDSEISHSNRSMKSSRISTSALTHFNTTSTAPLSKLDVTVDSDHLDLPPIFVGRDTSKGNDAEGVPESSPIVNVIPKRPLAITVSSSSLQTNVATNNTTLNLQESDIPAPIEESTNSAEILDPISSLTSNNTNISPMRSGLETSSGGVSLEFGDLAPFPPSDSAEEEEIDSPQIDFPQQPIKSIVDPVRSTEPPQVTPSLPSRSTSTATTTTTEALITETITPSSLLTSSKFDPPPAINSGTNKIRKLPPVHVSNIAKVTAATSRPGSMPISFPDCDDPMDEEQPEFHEKQTQRPRSQDRPKQSGRPPESEDDNSEDGNVELNFSNNDHGIRQLLQTLIGTIGRVVQSGRGGNSQRNREYTEVPSGPNYFNINIGTINLNSGKDSRVVYNGYSGFEQPHVEKNNRNNNMQRPLSPNDDDGTGIRMQVFSTPRSLRTTKVTSDSLSSQSNSEQVSSKNKSGPPSQSSSNLDLPPTLEGDDDDGTNEGRGRPANSRNVNSLVSSTQSPRLGGPPLPIEPIFDQFDDTADFPALQRRINDVVQDR